MPKFMPDFTEKSEGKGKGGKMPPQFMKRSKRMKRGKERGRGHARMQAKALSAQAAEENEV